jgi:hypothetical protein
VLIERMRLRLKKNMYGLQNRESIGYQVSEDLGIT